LQIGGFFYAGLRGATLMLPWLKPLAGIEWKHAFVIVVQCVVRITTTVCV
jgi:hypothetical protein